MRRSFIARFVDRMTTTHAQATSNMGYDWSMEPRTHKSVVLCNVENCKNLSRKNVIDALKSPQLSMFAEYEPYMSELLVAAIDKAYKENLSTADVTEMFSFDIATWLEGAGTSITKQEEVEAILLRKLFDVVSETDDELRVTIKRSIIK